jgi:hypothetical protein
MRQIIRDQTTVLHNYYYYYYCYAIVPFPVVLSISLNTVKKYIARVHHSRYTIVYGLLLVIEWDLFCTPVIQLWFTFIGVRSNYINIFFLSRRQLL